MISPGVGSEVSAF